MDKTLEINGTRVAYSVVPGKGPTVVLMHGWGCDRSTLSSVQSVVEQCGNPVINIDFPGFGKSSEPTEVWGVEQYTRMLENLLSHENVGDDVILLGHSFGGRVGILYSSRNRVGKLILVDAAGVKPRRGVKYYFKVYSYKAARRFWQLLLGQEKAQRKIETARARRASADYMNASVRMRQILSRVVNEDLCGVMPLIKAPTLLVWGENDTATPISDARKMERLIPDAGLVSFPGCGHYSFLDNPAHFGAVIQSFLRS